MIIEDKADGSKWKLENQEELNEEFENEMEVIDAECPPYRG